MMIPIKKFEIKNCLKKMKNNVKIIFLNYLEFHNVKQEMNLEKVNNLNFSGEF